MDPLSALGVASNIIQIVDFSSRIISRSHEIYKSVDGRSKEHAVLDDAAKNLRELSSDLGKYTRPNLRSLNAADKQLVRLRRECEEVVQELRDALEDLKLEGDHTKWQSIHQALRSIWTQRDISDLEMRLDKIRKGIDTALLVSLRRSISEISKSLKVDCKKLVSSASDQARERHDELLSAIRENNWQPSRSDHVAGFSDQLQSTTAKDLECRFCEIVLARLYFSYMPDRAESILEAHQNTFEWIFRRQDPGSDLSSWDDFTDWLQRDDSSIYWITGKPGSGKSTLMKFLSHHKDLAISLEKWAPENLSKAGFYFWNSGAIMQKSHLGLLQTLLHDCLRSRRDLILSIFPERWEQFVAFGGGRDRFEWPELRRAFKSMISDRSIKFFFLIDGLDEFDGEPKDIINLIKEAAQPNVKICTASRPWLAFEDAFKNRPSLLLEQITHKDIVLYVNSQFDENEYFRRLKDREPHKASDLVQQVVGKSSGVFLWVYLVVESLLQGLSNSDRMSDLQVRLDALPSDLEELFDKLLSRLDPEYFTRACKVFRLIHAYNELAMASLVSEGTPTLLELYFADDEDTKSWLQAPRTYLRYDEAQEKMQDMRRRLNARCRGFLDTRMPATDRNIMDRQVNYLHRTAKDFIESEDFWPTVLETTDHDGFDPNEHWANAFLWYEKSFLITDRASAANSRHRCVMQALYMQNKTRLVPKTYLDALFSTQRTLTRRHPVIEYLHYPFMKATTTLYGLTGYLTVVLETASQDDCERILESCKSYSIGLMDTVKGSKEEKAYHHLVKYYSMPLSMRWMRRQPKLPAYE